MTDEVFAYLRTLRSDARLVVALLDATMTSGSDDEMREMLEATRKKALRVYTGTHFFDLMFGTGCSEHPKGILTSTAVTNVRDK